MSAEPPVLSVLVPTYNYGGYIEEALASVLDQAAAGVEIVVADDGSTDGTGEILRPRVEAGQIRYLRQENRGPSAARNLAVAEARGSLLMFLDADDALMPGCLKTTIAFMQRHPEVGLFFTNYDLFDASGVVTASGVDIWKVFRKIPHREVDGDGWIFTEPLTPYIIGHGAFMHTSGLTVRRDVAERAGPFRDGFSYGEDDDFYARAAYLAAAGYVDRVLSRKRNHGLSLIHENANRLRNARHILELTEIQRGDYPGDRRMEAILRRKVRDCAEAYAWHLVENGDTAGARNCLLRYLPRYPFHGPFYRLWLKALLRGRRRPAS